jgi:hypothetical protein
MSGSKKSRSRRSSTKSSTQKTKPAKNQHSARKQRGTKPTAGKRAQSLDGLRRLKAGKRLVADMAADSSLFFTPTAHKRGLDPRWVLREFSSQLEKDSSGRIRAKARSRRRKTLYIPTATPDVRTPVATRNKAGASCRRSGVRSPSRFPHCASTNVQSGNSPLRPGEEKAHACDNACLRQLRPSHPPLRLRLNSIGTAKGLGSYGYVTAKLPGGGKIRT